MFCLGMWLSAGGTAGLSDLRGLFTPSDSMVLGVLSLWGDLSRRLLRRFRSPAWAEHLVLGQTALGEMGLVQPDGKPQEAEGERSPLQQQKHFVLSNIYLFALAALVSLTEYLGQTLPVQSIPV